MDVLEIVFWGCFVFGVVYCFSTLVFGEIFDNFFHLHEIPFIQPLTLVSFIAAFGGSGIILFNITQLQLFYLILFPSLIGLFLSTICYFFWIKPMSNAESSLSYSINRFVGTMVEVQTTIPPNGYGEVVSVSKSGNSNQIAASYDGNEIKEGEMVLVKKVEDNVLYVVKL